MRRNEFTRDEVIKLLDELLQRPQVLIDALTNENTEYDAETLLYDFEEFIDQ